MRQRLGKHHLLFAAIFAGATFYGAEARTAMDPRFELNPQQLSAAKKAPAKSVRVPVKRTTRRQNSPALHKKSKGAAVQNAEISPAQTLSLPSPFPVLSDQEAVTRVSAMWEKIVPATQEQLRPLSLQTEAFSLVLDPAIYPSFTRMDGGRILLDHGDTIPPLVKSLIKSKDASVKIVTESPADAKSFIGSLLESAGFYSVEENFSMEFGADPKLSVKADYKVEKTAESLIKQEVVLINSGRSLLPASLGEFLNKEGFSLYEPFASLKPFAGGYSRTIHTITAKNQPELIDSILSSLSVDSERDKRVDVYATDNNGISLTVKTDRYFERGGGRFVVTRFDRDPINYTLLRILETKGYHVVILEDQDDFRKISEKLISSLKIKGVFARHDLVKDTTAGYSLQMSGYKLDDASLPGGGLLLTDRAMDRIVRELLSENGFTFSGK